MKKPAQFCKICGKAFPWRMGTHKPVECCSRACAGMLCRQRRTVSKPCLVCGKAITGRKSEVERVQCCSPECGATYRKNSNTHLLRTCEWCGKEFRRWGNHKIKFCSIACRIGHQRRNKLNSRIAQNLRSRISKIIREKSLGGRTQRLLGCSYDELIAHLQSQWKPGMTWANYGTDWHVDHIIACANYNQRDPIHVRECHHFTNLQPLWASENISKGASL